MVDNQVRPTQVRRYAVLEAMLWCPRELFVPRAWRELAYAGIEVPLGDDRYLMDPRTLAMMLDAVDVNDDDLVLDVAPGTGYSTALLAHMAEAVVAVEPVPELARTAQTLMDRLEVVNAAIGTGDPTQGDPAHGPYDIIFINGGIERLPEALTTQLKDGGRLIAVFREGDAGHCRVLSRSGEAVSGRSVFDATSTILPGFEKPAEFTF